MCCEMLSWSQPASIFHRHSGSTVQDRAGPVGSVWRVVLKTECARKRVGSPSGEGCSAKSHDQLDVKKSVHDLKVIHNIEIYFHGLQFQELATWVVPVYDLLFFQQEVCIWLVQLLFVFITLLSVEITSNMIDKELLCEALQVFMEKISVNDSGHATSGSVSALAASSIRDCHH